jgi:hypothetical protein
MGAWEYKIMGVLEYSSMSFRSLTSQLAGGVHVSTNITLFSSNRMSQNLA